MTTTLRSTINAQLGWTWHDRLGTCLITDSNRLEFSQDLADGSGSRQADAVWHAQDQTLDAGQSTTLDLDMLQQDLFGDVITIPLARVKAILVVNKNTAGGGYLVVGGADADEWDAPFGASGDTVKVMPGSPLLLANAGEGWPVEIGQSALKIAAAGGNVTFDCAVLGTLPDESGSSSSSSSSSSSGA